MNYNMRLQGGQIVLEDRDQRQHFMKQLLSALAIKDDEARFRAVAQIVEPPIRLVAPYLEWSGMFFAPRTITAGEHVRIALDQYTAHAYYSSPDGGIRYHRPSRLYTTISWRQITAGLKLDWDLGEWGWDVVSMKMLEVAEELARRRDELRQPLLNAAAISQAGHIPTVASALTKASIDSIIKTSNTNGFPVTQAAINTGTLMDMAGWTLPANSMVSGSMPTQVGQDIFNKLFSNGYGTLTWMANHSVPSNYVYLSGPASNVGWFYTKEGMSRASEQDIDNGLDKHVWRQKIAAYVGGSQWVWRLEIT